MASNQNRSLTSALIEISQTKGIPLSTLKLNAKVLRSLGLISMGELNGRRSVSLTNLGRIVLSILDSDVGSEEGEGKAIDIVFSR